MVSYRPLSTRPATLAMNPFGRGTSSNRNPGIHQADPELMQRGIYGLGGFLKASSEMRILWSPPYLSRLPGIYVGRGFEGSGVFEGYRTKLSFNAMRSASAQCSSRSGGRRRTGGRGGDPCQGKARPVGELEPSTSTYAHNHTPRWGGVVLRPPHRPARQRVLVLLYASTHGPASASAKWWSLSVT